MFYFPVHKILYTYIMVSISNTIERLLPESIDSREKKKTKIYFAQLQRKNERDRERMGGKKGQLAIDFGQVQRGFWQRCDHKYR